MKFQPVRLPASEPGRLIRHIALVGNFLPRRCGIATYTADVFEAMTARFPGIDIDVWAMNDGNTYAHASGSKPQFDDRYGSLVYGYYGMPF